MYVHGCVFFFLFGSIVFLLSFFFFSSISLCLLSVFRFLAFLAVQFFLEKTMCVLSVLGSLGSNFIFSKFFFLAFLFSRSRFRTDFGGVLFRRNVWGSRSGGAVIYMHGFCSPYVRVRCTAKVCVVHYYSMTGQEGECLFCFVILVSGAATG